MKENTIKEILSYLKDGNFCAQYFGNEEVCVNSFSHITELKDNTVAWIKNKKYLTEEVISSLRKYKNVIIVCPWKTDEIRNSIVTDSPKEVFFSILNHFFREQKKKGISDRAVVETKKIGNNVSIGPGCYICEDVEIADDVILHANVVIDCPCKIGKGTEIFAGVVIGSDGFGYYHHNDIPERVPHFGGVIIGECVDIGANTCIDRGCLDNTVIGDYVKIDNMCMIAHNVNIGAKTLIVAGTTICGSVVVGEKSYLAPESVIKNQVKIGDNSFIGMNTVLSTSVEPRSFVIDSNKSIQILKNQNYMKILSLLSKV